MLENRNFARRQPDRPLVDGYLPRDRVEGEIAELQGEPQKIARAPQQRCRRAISSSSAKVSRVIVGAALQPVTRSFTLRARSGS